MTGFDMLAFGISMFDTDNPLVTTNRKLHSSTLYNTAQIIVTGIAALSRGAYKGIVNGEPTCFVAGTLVLTAGGLIAIENIKAGDRVLATDPDTRECIEKTVLETYVRKVSKLVHLQIHGVEVITTSDHPFYVNGCGFLGAGELYVGAKMITANGEIHQVERMSLEYGKEAEEPKVEVNEGGGTSQKGLVGHDFEDFLTKNIGGDGSFGVDGRDFDGGLGNRWWEAKSGRYWEMLESNPNRLEKFKSDMGDRLRIATENGATYELFSNTPIPVSIKQWLDQKGIAYTELLD